MKPASKMKAPNLGLESLNAMTSETEHFEILLAEDNLEDAELVRLALKAQECTLRVIRDGAALDLLIVDMNLPKRSGEDILKCLRSTENCAQTPVIVMSGLIAGAPEEKAMRQAAMVYLQKPLTLNGFMQLGSIGGYVLQKQTRGAA